MAILRISTMETTDRLLVLGNDQLFSICLYCFDISTFLATLVNLGLRRWTLFHIFGVSGSLGFNALHSRPSAPPFCERLVYLHNFVLVCWSFPVVEEEKIGLDERVRCYKRGVLPTLRVFRLCHVPSSTLCTADTYFDPYLCLY